MALYMEKNGLVSLNEIHLQIATLYNNNTELAPCNKYYIEHLMTPMNLSMWHIICSFNQQCMQDDAWTVYL